MRRSKVSGRARSIERASAESKNTWISGRLAEDWALRDFEGRGFSLVRQRWQSPFGEIDLWLRHPDHGDWFIEVKTLVHPEHLGSRVSRAQRRRIARHLVWLAERFPRFSFRIVYVTPEGQCLELGAEDLLESEISRF